MKRQPTEWEKIFVTKQPTRNYSPKYINTNSSCSSIPKTKQLNQTMSGRSNRYLSKEDIQMAKRAYIFSYRWKDAQHHWLLEKRKSSEVPPHAGQYAHHQKVYKQLMLERVWQKGNLLCCWSDCKLVHPLWGTIWSFLKKLKTDLPYDPAIPLLATYSEKTIIQKIHTPQCSLRHYLQ